MDGGKGSVTRSLQFRLSLWLALVTVAVALAAALFSFFSAFDEAIELQDEQLRQIGVLIAQQVLPFSSAPIGKHVGDADSERRIVVQELRRSAATGAASGGPLGGLPADLGDGLRTKLVQGDRWRLFVTGAASGRRFAVGQLTAVRDEIARDSALRTALPLFILIPILLLVIGELVRRMFRPIKTLASELDRRSDDDLRPVAAAALPSEVRPFVVAINRLLVRVTQSMQTQQRFLADAAHELRSPVAALTLQAERIESAATPEQAAERLATLRSGLQRTRALLEQLLSMARAQSSVDGAPPHVLVEPVLRRVIEDLLPLADAKHIDLGVVGEPSAQIAVDEIDLRTLVKNLVENAIRYTPAGGRVDVSLQASPAGAGAVTLRVDDTGPGIAEAERERVFDPFYRIVGRGDAGSGLGLAIANAIAKRCNARVALGPSHIEGAAPGLGVSVSFEAFKKTPGSFESPRRA